MWGGGRGGRGGGLAAPHSGSTTEKGGSHGLINFIDTNAKCRHLKKLPVKGLCGSCLSFLGPSPLMTIYPPLQRILYVLIRTGKGVVMSKTKGQIFFPISFFKRNQNVLVLFPNFSD